MNMICMECNKNKENIITFKGDEEDYFICEVCWDEKLNKGNKNHISFVNRCKEFKPSPKTGRI